MPLRITLSVLLLSMLTHTQAQEKLTPDDIKAKLEHAYDLDQDVRLRFGQAKPGTPAYKALRDSLVYVDSVNQSVVFPILDTYGWLGKRATSEKASSAYYYVIQHADSAGQAKYQTFIEKAYKKKEITNLDYARFVDRLLFRQGKFQRYGLQNGIDPLGNSYLYPIRDVKATNKHRQKAGFPKIQDELSDNQVYEVPGLSKFKYPVVFMAHFASDNKFSTPAPGIIILCDGKEIGRSNERGLVYIGLNKPPHETVQLIFQRGDKKINYTLKGERDFYEYWGVWNNK